jgi:tRNA (guanosine-2'-O-)-methyltransferase
LAVVLEDVYQPHNASAVLRTCECFGVQDVHVVEGSNEFRISRTVDIGASKWLSLFRYADIETCADVLRERGYRLVGATPHEDSCPLDELRVEGPLAVLFGTEESGLSDSALAAADSFVSIPMRGFSESFNVSVSAALILRELAKKLRRSAPDWGLSAVEKLDLRLEWYRRSVREAALIEARFMAERQIAGGLGAHGGTFKGVSECGFLTGGSAQIVPGPLANPSVEDRPEE